MRHGLLVAALLLPVHAFATMMVTPPVDSTTTIFPLPGSSAAAIQSLQVGQFTITGQGVVYGYGAYSLGPNGSWNGTTEQFAWVGTNDTPDLIRIDLGASYKSVGGFMSYAPGLYVNPYIAVMDAAGLILNETVYLKTEGPIDTPFGLNQGAFRGISHETADIRYLVLAGGNIVLRDITVAGGSPPVEDPGQVPEPATLGAGMAALVVAAAAARRR